MALLGAVKAQSWAHAEDTVSVTESVQGQVQPQQQEKWAAQPVCFLLPSGVLGCCPARKCQSCALLRLLREEAEFSSSSVPFCRAGRQECCVQCQVGPAENCTLCVHQTKTRVQFWSLEAAWAMSWCFSRECSLILAGRNDSAWTDRDRCLFSPSPLQSRQIRDSQRADKANSHVSMAQSPKQHAKPLSLFLHCLYMFIIFKS